jgi:hypothetical protein
VLAVLGPITDVAYEAVHATVLHTRRIAGAVSSAVTRVTKEVKDLVWDYQDMAGELRRSAVGVADDMRWSAGDMAADMRLPDVGLVDLRRPADGYPGRVTKA